MALSRRDLLCKSAAGGASFAAAGLMANCGPNEPMTVEPPMEIPASIDTNTTSATYGQVTVSLTQNSFLTRTGAAVLLRYNVPGSLPFTVPSSGLLLVHRGSATDQPEWIAVSAVCTHAACFVNYDEFAKNIACPCHDGRYAAKTEGTRCLGDVMSGPQPSPLPAYTVKVDTAKQIVAIDLRTPPACGEGPTMKFQAKVVNNKIELPFAADAAVAELQKVGGQWHGGAVGLGDTLVVARVDQTTVVAQSTICTHAGCITQYQTANKNFRCGCHGSVFGLDGKVVAGPAGRAVKSYAAVLSADKVTITVA